MPIYGHLPISLASYFMAYHTILRDSVDFTDGLRKARKISENLTLTLNQSNVTVFPYR